MTQAHPPPPPRTTTCLGTAMSGSTLHTPCPATPPGHQVSRVSRVSRSPGSPGLQGLQGLQVSRVTRSPGVILVVLSHMPANAFSDPCLPFWCHTTKRSNSTTVAQPWRSRPSMLKGSFNRLPYELSSVDSIYNNQTGDLIHAAVNADCQSKPLTDQTHASYFHSLGSSQTFDQPRS